MILATSLACDTIGGAGITVLLSIEKSPISPGGNRGALARYKFSVCQFR